MRYKRILIAIGALAAVLITLLNVIQSRIDTDSLRKQIEMAVLQKTGFPLTVKGRVGVSILPMPTVYLSGVELHDTDEKTTTPVPALSVDMVSVQSSIIAFISGNPDVQTIHFENPVLEIQRSQENNIRWGWLAAALQPAENGQSYDVSITNGSIVYRNAKNDSEKNVKNIQASIHTGAAPQASGSLYIEDHSLMFDMESGSQQSNGSVPLKLSLATDLGDKLSLTGTANFSSDTPEISGNIQLKSENIIQWFHSKTQEESDTLFAKFMGPAANQQMKLQGVVPLSIAGTWLQSGTKVKVTIDTFEGLNSAGAGVIEAEWGNTTPRIDTKINFSALNYDFWKAMILTALRSNKLGESGEFDTKENPLPDDITASFEIDAKQVYYGDQAWKDARFAATLDKAAVTIHQLDVQLPGESSLSLFGIVSQNSTREMRFEGTMETQGKSLRELFTIFDVSALDLPEEELGSFNIRSNIYVSADQIRLSEADAKISQLHLNGGLVAYYEGMPRFEAEVKLNDINFDYFRDAWRRQYKPKEKETYFLQYDQSQNFNWLKKLRASVDFKVNVDKFRFMERDGDSASFRIFLQQGEFGVYNVRFNYPGSTIEAGFNLDVKGDQPFFNVMLNTDVLDTKYFRANTDQPKTDEAKSEGTKRWPEDLIDMGWMDGWKGAFDITIGKFIHEGWSINDIKTRASLDKAALSISGLSFDYWGGKVQTNGSIYGGKVPGMGFTFTLSGIEINDMLRSLVKRDNISGKLNINGAISTSGVNILSWVSQAEADFILNGQGIRVDGFNLQGVIDAVSVSRTAADVLNNVNLALLKGLTQMSVEGSLNVKKGVMRSPGIVMKSGNIAGTMMGEIKLIPWKIDVTEVFQFPTLSSEKIPVMNLQLTGPLEKPDMGVDTASLEAYVAKRLTGGSGK